MVQVEAKELYEIKSDVLAINLFQDEDVFPSDLATFDKITNGAISSAIRNRYVTGTLFEVASLLLSNTVAGRLLLVGSGNSLRIRVGILLLALGLRS